MSDPSFRERMRPYFQPRPRNRAGTTARGAAAAGISSPRPAPGGQAPAAQPPAVGNAELLRRREQLAHEMARLHWDLGGLTYEMAVRDHFRLDLLVRQAARLQQVDAELGAIDRMLRLEQAGAAGECPSCGALYPRGAVYCGQCGNDLVARVTLASPAAAPPPAPDTSASPPPAPTPAPDTSASPPSAPTSAAAPEVPIGGHSDLKQLLGLLPTRAQVASARSLLTDWTQLNWAALPVTDRRWTVPLAATAVAMGLFIGVAMGPGIGSTIGALPQVVQVVGGEDTTDSGGDSGAGGDDGAPALGSPVDNTPAPPSPAGGSAPSITPAVTTAPPPPTAPPPATEEAPPAPPPDTTEETPPPDTEEELSFKGTVIHVNQAAASYVVTTAKGQMNAVHAKKLPEPGTKLEVAVRALANGTYAEDGKESAHGSAKKAKFQGLVTYADPATGDYTVSRKGASVFVHAPADAETPPAPPEVGTEVTVSAKLGDAPPESGTVEGPPVPEPPPTPTPLFRHLRPRSSSAALRAEDCGVPSDPPQAPTTILTEVSHEVDIGFLGYSDFEGIVQGVCADGDLLLSADDLRESGADLTFTVEADAGLDLSDLTPGDVVDASGLIDEDTRKLSLTGISSDDGIKGADDSELAQGDQAG